MTSQASGRRKRGGGKRDKTKLIANRSHSLAPHSSAPLLAATALPPAGDEEETLQPSAAQMCQCNYTEGLGSSTPSRHCQSPGIEQPKPELPLK